MIKYSIIVPVYNKEKYIKKCIDSLINQNYINYEVIIINDGSTDKSEEIIKKYKSDKIKYFKKENGGLSEARNYGVEKATGDYILFVDGDDYVSTELLKKVNEAYLKNKDAEVIKYNYAEIINGITKLQNYKFNKTCYSSEEIFIELINSNQSFEMACIYAYKRNYWLKNHFKFPVKKYHEDFGLIPMVILFSKKIVSINEVLYYYLRNDDSITNDKNKDIVHKKAFDTLDHFNYLYSSVNKNKEITEKTKMIFNSFIANAVIEKAISLEGNILKKYYVKTPEDSYLPISRKAINVLSIENPIDLYDLPNIINIFKHTGKQILEYLKYIIDFDIKEAEKIYLKNKININKVFNSRKEYDKFISIVIKNFYNVKKLTNYRMILKEYFSSKYFGKAATFDIGYSARPEAIISKLYEKSIDTYFVHLNCDKGYSNAAIGKFNIKTFYDYRPSYTGVIREMFMSELNPSCIAYKIEENRVVPEFEEYTCSYQTEFIINKAQKGALDFVNDLTNTFDKELFKLYFQNYNASIPFEMYLHSSKELDRSIFKSINFEDSIANSKNVNIMNDWRIQLDAYNQVNIDILYNLKNIEALTSIDLKDRRKISKLIFYLLFDREYLKVLVREKIKNPFIIGILKLIYKILRKVKLILNKFINLIKKASSY